MVHLDLGRSKPHIIANNNPSHVVYDTRPQLHDTRPVDLENSYWKSMESSLPSILLLPLLVYRYGSTMASLLWAAGLQMVLITRTLLSGGATTLCWWSTVLRVRIDGGGDLNPPPQFPCSFHCDPPPPTFQFLLCCWPPSSFFTIRTLTVLIVICYNK